MKKIFPHRSENASKKPRPRCLFLKKTASFSSDASGAAAVEFAIIFMSLIILYAVFVELSFIFTIKRKLFSFTDNIANIVAQSPSVNSAILEKLLESSDTVMWPYNWSNVSARVTSVMFDAQKEAFVDWSFTNDPATFPQLPQCEKRTQHIQAALREPMTSIIKVTTTYVYELTFPSLLPIDTITLSETAFRTPRLDSDAPPPPEELTIEEGHLIDRIPIDSGILGPPTCKLNIPQP